MTEKEREIIESIKRDTLRKTDEEILEFCRFNEITLEQYRKDVDRALAARAQKMPPNYPKAIIRRPGEDKN